jgi:hypothetical protein
MPDFSRLDDDALLALLEAISKDDYLREGYVVKGGNALRFAYAGARASVDLDLTATTRHPEQTAAESEATLDLFCERLNRALVPVAPSYGFASMIVQSRRVLPPKRDPRTFPSFKITVGYSKRADRSPPFAETIPLDVTLNDVVCASEYVDVGAATLHVSSLDDIIAEKLRALLQQIPRNRNRPADVFDLWYHTTRARRLLDPKRISAYLIEKSDEKEGLGLITRASFHNPDVRARAEVDYELIAERLRGDTRLPPFDRAFNQVLAFVGKLDLPEE